MKTGHVAGNKQLQSGFCPECGTKIEDAGRIVCDQCKDKLWDAMGRTLKYSCRVCGAPAANKDTYCRNCGLEHL